MNPKQYIVSVFLVALAFSYSYVFADNYIVVLKSSAVQNRTSGLHSSFTKGDVIKTMMTEMANQYHLKSPRHVFSAALEGGVYDLTVKQLGKLSHDSRVDYVEKDQPMYATAVQSSPDWGLDRLDQVSLPLDSSYIYPTSRYLANVYVIDTGILTTHEQFQGRALHGYDAVDRDYDATDCMGHGTHVAGTIGGKTYGVAKDVRLYAVRVLNCDGSGSNSDVIAGIEWVTSHHATPAVANMSLGGGPSAALDNAIKASVRSGVTYVVAAGNDNYDACYGSPARVSTAIAVGSTTSNDTRSSFSNYGRCVSIFAPGSDIKSAWIGSNYAVNTISGTSMATPHVAGAAALYLAQNPYATPAQVKSALTGSAVSNKVVDAGSGSPNLLLNIQFLGATAQ